MHTDNNCLSLLDFYVRLAPHQAPEIRDPLRSRHSEFKRDTMMIMRYIERLFDTVTKDVRHKTGQPSLSVGGLLRLRKARAPTSIMIIGLLAMSCDGGGPLIFQDASQGDADAEVDGSNEDGGTPDSDTDFEAGDSNRAPEAIISVTPSGGLAPLQVTLDGSASLDPDGDALAFHWSIESGEMFEGSVVETLLTSTGCTRLTLTVVDPGGLDDQAEAVVVVTPSQPEDEPLVSYEVLPRHRQVYPRNLDDNIGTIVLSGHLERTGYERITMRLHGEEVLIAETEQPLCPDESGLASFELELPIEAGLTNHRLEISLIAGEEELLLRTVNDLVAGDVLLINGQSNAVARAFDGDANVNQHPFIRSWGRRGEDLAALDEDRQWHEAEGNESIGPGAVGQWALRMGRALVDRHSIPLAIVNGARGGQVIGYFQRDDGSPEELTTNYGRLLWRARRARVDGDVRAILFYQGESDDADALGHHEGFLSLLTDWQEDFPSVEHVYVTQIRNGSCGGDVALREVQRQFPEANDVITVMSTTGLDGHDGCHYAYEGGYRELGERYADLLSRDLFGESNADVEPPNAREASLSPDGSEITVQFDGSDVALWDEGAELDFDLLGTTATIVDGRVSEGTLILVLSGGGQGATGLSYLGHPGSGSWVRNARGLGILAFQALTIR